MRKFDFDSRAFDYKRGQLIYVDLGNVCKGSEQQGKRPCVVVQNDMGNKFAPTLIVAPITSQTGKRPLPTHVALDSEQYYLDANSTILAEQVKVVSKERCVHYMGELTSQDMGRLNRSLAISLGLQ